MPEEKQQKQHVNVEVDHSKEVFYTNDFAVNVSRNREIVIDFRQTLPRADVLPNGQAINSISVKHTAIIMQPTLMKMLVLILKENLEKLEKEMGKIKLPDKWKMGKKKEKIIATKSESSVGYIG